MPTLPNQLASLQPFLDQYTQRETQANQANERRYQQLLRLNRTGGVADRNRIRQAGADEIGTMQQGLINRGLFNTTIMDSLSNRSRESTQRQLTDSFENQRSVRSGIIERRTDQQPNAALLTSLLQGAAAGFGQQAGQSGAGSSRSFNFAGVNPSRFAPPGMPIGGMGGLGGGGTGGGGGGDGPSFGQGGTGGSGGGSDSNSTTTVRGRGFTPLDENEIIYVPGMGRMPRWRLREIYSSQPRTR